MASRPLAFLREEEDKTCAVSRYTHAESLTIPAFSPVKTFTNLTRGLIVATFDILLLVIANLLSLFLLWNVLVGGWAVGYTGFGLSGG